MVIQNGSRAKRILEMENYYNLINGYKGLFLNPGYNGTDEQYLPGTNFNEIYVLYHFDRELRSLFLRYILQIENNVKSVLAHKFSEQYGYDNYLKVTNFEMSLKQGERKTQAQKIGVITDLISGLQHEYPVNYQKIIQWFLIICWNTDMYLYGCL